MAKLAIVNGNGKFRNNEEYKQGKGPLYWFETFKGVANNLHPGEVLFIRCKKYGIVQKCIVDRIEDLGYDGLYIIHLKDIERVAGKCREYGGRKEIPRCYNSLFLSDIRCY